MFALPLLATNAGFPSNLPNNAYQRQNAYNKTIGNNPCGFTWYTFLEKTLHHSNNLTKKHTANCFITALQVILLFYFWRDCFITAVLRWFALHSKHWKWEDDVMLPPLSYAIKLMYHWCNVTTTCILLLRFQVSSTMYVYYQFIYVMQNIKVST